MSSGLQSLFGGGSLASFGRLLQVLADPASAKEYHERVWIPRVDGRAHANLSFVEVSDEYVDLVWDRIVDASGALCPDYSRLARLLSTDDDENTAASGLRPIEARNLTSFGGGAYVRFKRADVLRVLAERTAPSLADSDQQKKTS